MYDNIDDTPASVYYWCHARAMHMEILLYKNVAAKLGYNLSLGTLLFTLPRLLNAYVYRTNFDLSDELQRAEIFEAGMANFHYFQNSDEYNMPSQEEIITALDFWHSVSQI